jgi:hypothetical protein
MMTAMMTAMTRMNVKKRLTRFVRDIEAWKGEAKERRMTLQKAPAIEADSWLQFTQWNEVLSRSKLNMTST